MRLVDLFFYRSFDVWGLYASSDFQPGRELILYECLPKKGGPTHLKIVHTQSEGGEVNIEGYELPLNGRFSTISNERFEFKINGVYRSGLNLVSLRPGWGPPQVPPSWVERGVI